MVLVSQQAIRNADIRSKKHKNAEIRFAGRIVNRACVCNYHDCKSEVLRESTRTKLSVVASLQFRACFALKRDLTAERTGDGMLGGRRGFLARPIKISKLFRPAKVCPVYMQARRAILQKIPTLFARSPHRLCAATRNAFT